MTWVAAVSLLRDRREAGVLVTVVEVRGHAPREAGAKMVVATDESWGTVGGGDLEATALDAARQILTNGVTQPQEMTHRLSEHEPHEHGVQCCGGDVTLLFEPLRVVPSVAIFGMGHVGLELARILARHDLDLHVVDTRPGALTDDALGPLADAVARVVRHPAVVPEVVLGEVPPGTHVLILTHDHAEDLAILDMALRSGHLGSVGLIGSSAKWRRFRATLAAEGHPTAALDQVTTPIGLPELRGKDPATIAIGVAASLLVTIETPREVQAAPGRVPT